MLDRKTRLETTINGLAKESAGLVARLEATTLTADQIQNLQEFAARVAQGLAMAEEDFETQRRVIEALDVQATLTVESGEKIIYARCILGERILPVASNSTRAK